MLLLGNRSRPGNEWPLQAKKFCVRNASKFPSWRQHHRHQWNPFDPVRRRVLLHQTVVQTRHHRQRVIILYVGKTTTVNISLINHSHFCCCCCLECTGCSKEIVEGQALIALDSQWHVWCFKCATCNTLLHGEYMGKYVGNKSFYHRLPLHCQFFYRRGRPYLLIFSSLDGIFCYLITDTMCLIT